MAETDLQDTIEDAAQKPRTVEVDGTRTTQHPIGDLIAADQHLKRASAATKAHRGLYFAVFKPRSMNDS